MKALPTSIGRYQIRERIGQGGMGVLYLALDPAIDRPVAIKVLRIHDEDVHERFIREAKSAGRLQHPNIITIFDVGEHEGQPFIAMEYIAGETLAEIIKRRAAIPLLRKLELIEHLCNGLEYAHRAGIVHRDVKPSNVMVNRDGVLKVLDFGIARLADSSHTQLGVMMGTPSYMAPEQIENSRVDHRADIFAVGSVSYELIGYHQAFADDTHMSILRRVLNEEPAPLASLVPGLDPEISRIIELAMAKSPTERYQDLAAMSTDVARLRSRLAEATNDRTLADTPRPGATPTPIRRLLGRDDLVKLRREQTERHLQTAAAAFERNDLDTALNAANEAALIDPDYPATVELIARIQVALDERAKSAHLDDAEHRLRDGALTEALNLVGQACDIGPSERADQLRTRVNAAIEQRESERERDRALLRALEHGRQSLASGSPESAIRSADEALVYLPSSDEARDLKRRAQKLVEDRQREALETRATNAIAEAQADFARGDREGALQRLATFEPRDPRITRALELLKAELAALQARERQSAADRTRTPPRDRVETPPRRENANPWPAETPVWTRGAEAFHAQYPTTVVGNNPPATTVHPTGEELGSKELAPGIPGTIDEFDQSRDFDDNEDVDDGAEQRRQSESDGDKPPSRVRLIAAAGAVVLAALVAGTVYYRARPSASSSVPVQTPVEIAAAEPASGGEPTPPTPSPPPAAQPPPPGTTNVPPPSPPELAVDPQATELLNQSRRLLAAGQLNEAAGLAAQVRRRWPNLPSGTTAVTAVIDAARGKAQSAKEAATVVKGASDLASYRSAEASVAVAERARRAVDEAAVTRYLEAERGYVQAANEGRAILTQVTDEERQLTQWVNGRLAQARDQVAAQRWQEAQQTYNEIKARAPQTAGLDTLIGQLERQRSAAETQQWAARQVTALEQAIAKEQWTEADRLTAEIRQRAPTTGRLDELQSQIDRGKAASANRTSASGAGGGVPTRSSVDENAAIDAVLRQFGQGYSQQSLAEMKRVWPSMPANTADTYQRSFNSHSFQQWQFDRTSVSVEGLTAAVACEVRISQQGIRERQPQTERRRYRISLRKSANGWEIVALQFDGAL